MAKIIFYHKSTCSTCRRARSFLLGRKHTLVERDLGKQPMSVEELRSLIGERDYLLFLNTRNELYRNLKMKLSPPSKEAALKLMAKEPNLIRRPIAQMGARLHFGFDEEQFRKEF